MSTAEVQVEVVKSGILLKRPFGKVSSTWKPRFFLLKSCFLFYYEAAAAKAFNKSSLMSVHPKGVLPLDGSTVEIIPPNKQQMYAFQIIHGSRAFFFAASSEEEQSEWVSIIRAAVSSGNSGDAGLSVKLTKAEADLEKARSEVERLQEELAKLKRQRSAQPMSPMSPMSPMMSPQGGADLSGGNFPKIGDHVVSYHHPTTAFYTSKVVKFNRDTYEYTVNWDDGDPTGRTMKFDEVALNDTPEEDEVAVGSLVIFPQGKYVGTAGNNEGGVRYHKGKVTSVREENGVKLYDGHHTETPENSNKQRFRAYEYNFTGLKLEEIRMAPNVLDIVGGQSNSSEHYDVFFTYNNLDSLHALQAGEVEEPPSYQDLVKEHTDPRSIKKSLVDAGYSVWIDVDQPVDFNYSDMSAALQNSKVVVACVSNAFAESHDNRMQFQYAVKTLRKPVIAVVVEKYQPGPPWEWQTSVVGLLLAGELYVDFTDIENEQAKTTELIGNIKRIVDENSTAAPGAFTPSAPPADEAHDVFVSYCWTNSHDALTNGQVDRLAGNPHADPRKAARHFEDTGLSVWLDVKKLESGQEGLFDQIAAGLKTAKVVVAFISAEYASSANCRMEFQFACKSLRKPVIPVLVGDSDDWKESVVGMLVSSLDVGAIDLRDVDGQTIGKYLDSILDLSKQHGGVTETSDAAPVEAFKAPKKGDHVLAFHHPTNCFYLARVESFDTTAFTYTVNWDDGDPSGREMSFDLVAFNEEPAADEVSVGSKVIFPQGKYKGTEGVNEGGSRYHEGIVVKVEKTPSGLVYHGHHIRTPEEGTLMNFRAYEYEFAQPLHELRVACNAMDAIFAQQ